MRTFDEILSELAKKQRKNIPSNKRFQYTDLKRIAKHLNVSIFDSDDCSVWNGYITNMGNASKGIYINFYFRGKKYALHRLLYINFANDLGDDEYIKYSCLNKGKCCNINHLVKYQYTENITLKHIGSLEQHASKNINCSLKDKNNYESANRMDKVINKIENKLESKDNLDNDIVTSNDFIINF